MSSRLTWGPTYEEMLNPGKIDGSIRKKATEAFRSLPLDPINLYNISWKDELDQIRYLVLPKELTGVDATIVALVGVDLPTGSHKVGATYSVTMEAQLDGGITPGQSVLVFPSTGNYGIGGAWVGPRMGYETLVVLPELMSRERFEKIESYGAKYIKTTGCESSVKEIYDKCNELRKDPRVRILNQFEVMANYRFHYYVTGNTVMELVRDLERAGIGKGRCSAFVSAMGSSGTIAAGDRVKQACPEAKTIGLEPIQCPTLYNNGYGDHDIQGIGDKHVTWIHNVMNMDALICVDDMKSKMGLQLLTQPEGMDYLVGKAGLGVELVERFSTAFGISGVCNLLGAIKTAKFYRMDSTDVIVTVLTDGIDRYRSIMTDMEQRFGRLDDAKSGLRLGIFHDAATDFVQEGTVLNRDRWFNLKYYTWVEQQGKTVAELDAQRSALWWESEQAKVLEVDKRLEQARIG